MELGLLSFFKNMKLKTFLGITGVLFLYKVFLEPAGLLPFRIVGDLLVLLTIAALVIYFIEYLSSKMLNPLSLVMNLGIINVLLFCLITFSGSLFNMFFDNVAENIQNPGFMLTVFIFAYAFMVLASTAYIFLVFKELYFLKQKKNVSVYFNTMIVFIGLASMTFFLKNFPDYSFIKNTFLIISIILIGINSFKISWIAFLTKKEKISLLILSVVISILFVVNLINNTSAGLHDKILMHFSPALDQFSNIIMIYGAIYFTILFFTTLFHLPTAEAFDRKAQEVSSLQYFSKLITQVLDFNDLAETISDIAMKVCNAQAAWIVLKKVNDLTTLANKNIGYLDANLINNFIFRMEKDSSKIGTFMISMNKFEENEKLSEKYSTLAVTPLIDRKELRGYLVSAKKGDFIFDDEDKNALDTFSDYASVAIENARLLEESIEKERLEKELDVAREIQKKILPVKNPSFNELSISSVFIPAFEVGGDYYDFFDIAENKLGFIIADVSGKGISAAFVMAEIKGIFESLTKTYDNPKEILVRANQILKRTLDRKTFISAAFGLIDIKKRTLRISRAGHCPILILRDGVVENIRPTGIGLGLSFDRRFSDSLEEIEYKLKENDCIVLYTDGITEAKNNELEDFGDKVFEEILLESIQDEPDIIANKVIQKISDFTKNNSQHDDITLVILKWKQKINFNGEKEWQNSAPQLKTRVK
jgi:sigma-B regulation protein RsbU (phosphoserine phosphatase)